MFLILSGEGKTDIGTSDDIPGPMTKFIDQWITRRSGYSLVESTQYKIFTESEIKDETARLRRLKKLKTLSKRGKKTPPETQLYNKNARVLANLALQYKKDKGIDVIAVLFRDSDGSKSAGRGNWKDKWNSILKGFDEEGLSTGVPMVPKPKSEAWVLCALRNKYQHCANIEDESGNDNSPNSLKNQLESHLGGRATQQLLNEKIDGGEIDIHCIVDMPSLNKFKDRLDDVLDGFLTVPQFP